MSSKHGRTVSDTIENEALRRRRELSAARSRQYRARRRMLHTAPISASAAQMQQSNMIVNRTTLELEQIPETASGLGMRIQGATLPQDSHNASLQPEAQPVEEHIRLYQNTISEHSNLGRNLDFFRQFTVPRPKDNAHPARSSDNISGGLSRFFPSLPPSNPFVQAGAIAGPSLQDDSEPFDEGDDLHFLPDDGDHEAEGAVDGGDGDGTVARSLPNVIDMPLRGSEDQLGANNSDSEESFHDFASERSIHSGDSADEPAELSAREYTIQKLFDQLQIGFHGCTEAEHDEKMRRHMESAGNNHHGLNEVFNDASFPSVLGLSDMITPERLARQQETTAEQWEAMFCGTVQESNNGLPLNICMHKEETQAVKPDVAFDIDSILGFATSLAMARKGLWYQPAPQMRQNMKTDIHLETNMFRSTDNPEQPDRSSMAMLRDVPHFLLGRIVGAHDITLHVLFPHITPTQDKFIALSQEQLTRWTDQIFLPALHRHLPAHYMQHIPSSFRHGLANAKAHQVEGRKIETTSYQSQMSLGHHLQAKYLGDVWDDIVETINNTAGLADFREPQLFFQAIGTKLQFKTGSLQPTLLDAMEEFESYFDDLIDPAFVQLDRFYVDVGKEICAEISSLRGQQSHLGDEAQVYSWKRCCLEKYMSWMYDGQPPATGNRGQRYYEQNMLHEASSLTSLSPKRSKLREGGLIYTQFYGSVKEISDAAKCKPFDNDGLEEMTLDPGIAQGLRDATGGRRREARILEHAYLAGKRRTRDAIRDSLKKSFGIREEHRISWELFQGILSRLRMYDREDLEIALDDCPSYAWPVKTEAYLSYLWRSADKFATGFEVVRARSRRDMVRWEETKMMAMFLRCLRFVFGGYELRRESALWWSRRERTWGEPARTTVWYGLGFGNTLPRYGYCWLEPRIDWSRLQFQVELSDRVLFGNSALRGQYVRRGRHAQGFLDLAQRLELALIWMQRHQERGRVRQRLMEWMVEICLQQFRMDIMHSVRAEIRADHRTEAVKGETGFCMEYFDDIMIAPVYMVSGNKTNFKLAEQLIHFLFDFDDGRTRTHWESRPYRKLYQRAVTGISQALGGRRFGRWLSQELYRQLFKRHWLLPYPCTDVLLQTTKAGERMWYSVVYQARAEGQGREVSEWIWGGKGWQVGRPPASPRWMTWSKEDWEGWLER